MLKILRECINLERRIGIYKVPCVIMYEYKNGVLTEPDNRYVNSASRLYYAKQSVMNLWTNYYNNIKTNGTDFEGNGNKFRLVKLYSNSIASPNGKSSSWSGFTELKKISCKD